MTLEQARQLFVEGLAFLQREDYPAAERKLREAHALAPERTSVLNNLAAALLLQNKVAEAKRYAQRAVDLDARNAEGWLNLAGCLREEGDAAGALRCCERALALKPDDAAGWSNRGLALNALHRAEEALASFDRALAAAPGLSGHWVNRAITLADLQRYEESLASYEKAMQLKPTPYLHGDLLRARMQICRWDGFEAACERLSSGIERGERISVPFAALGIDTTPEQQLRCARIYVAGRYPNPAPPLPPKQRREGRIRIGYFSRDFREHATSYLMAGLLEQHDRKRFELLGFHYGPGTRDAMRKRVENAFDHFADVRTQSDAGAAAIARELGVDIAVDLNGHVGYSRLGIFAQRAAPVQVTFLGYPGSTAAPFMDYLVADPTVVPREHAAFYSEKIAWLPHCYQPNDAKREVARRKPTRAEAGLPDGFVFCCFNNPAKITPDVFDVWTGLLLQVPGSVLWLIENNPGATRNLREAARTRGISPDRLIFAPQLPAAEHLARQALADLCLDTLYYNAHTTAADSLWMGVPIVTRLGQGFPARVCASLLRAVGLPELVTGNLADYAALALALARDPARLAALRGKLERNRSTAPLFDTALFARHLEAAFAGMWERRVSGLPAENITVPA